MVIQKKSMSIAIDVSSWLNNNRKVVRHTAPVTMSKWIRDWSFSSEVLVKLYRLDLSGKG
jgi:hypothetical protein